MNGDLKPCLGSQIQMGHCLAKGLVGCWLFNEGAGNIVNDASGNGNRGTLINGVSHVGDYLHFVKSSSQYCVVPSSPSINQYSQITVETQVKLYGSVGSPWGGGIIASQFDDNYAFTCDWILELSTYDGWEKINVTSLPNSSTWWSTSFTSDYQPPGTFTGKWINICFTIDGTYFRSYINGVLTRDPVARNAGFLNSGRNLYIGTRTNLNNFGDLDIKHLNIYNRALSASEIAQIYQDPFCMFEEEV
jgi:hypothetical protein